MTPYPWTPQIDAEIIAARVRGELLRVIAARLGTSRTTLSLHLRTLDPALVSKPRGASWGQYPKPGPEPTAPAARGPRPVQSEVSAAKRALEALRQDAGLDAKAARDARLAAKRAENDARTAAAHQARMIEHQLGVRTWERLARKHVRSA
jgi:hypothetical protein